MRMRLVTLILALCLPALGGCLGMTEDQARATVAEYLALDSRHFAQTASLDDGPLAVFATFSTEPGFKVRQGVFQQVREDAFVRGAIDKASGERRFFVYQILSYRDRYWHDYLRVNYQAFGGPRQVAADPIFGKIDCEASPLEGYCNFKEHLGFPVDEVLLHAVAAEAVPPLRPADLWRFEFIPERGWDIPSALSPAEIKGLLDAMDAYQTAL